MMNMIKGFFGFLVGIYKERKIILNLAINDFKSKFTNSLLGMIWGFLLPLLTIFVLWYVFEIGLKSGTVKDVPFMLYYIPAYIAWNFFTEAFSGCCNCLIEGKRNSNRKDYFVRICTCFFYRCGCDNLFNIWVSPIYI